MKVQQFTWLFLSLILPSFPLSSQETNPPSNRPVVRIAYFIPTDRKPEPDYRARLNRVMTHVQEFYRTGMEQQGYGKLTFELDRDPTGALRIYEVAAKGKMQDYGRNDSGRVAQETRDALAKQNINTDRETVVIFQLLLDWQGGKAVEIGPYVGGGGPRNGTAWVYDDAKLDTRLTLLRQARVSHCRFYISGSEAGRPFYILSGFKSDTG